MGSSLPELLEGGICGYIHLPVVFQCWLLSWAAELLLPAGVCHQAPENREPEQFCPQTFCNLLVVRVTTHPIRKLVTPAAEVYSHLLTQRAGSMVVEPCESIHPALYGECAASISTFLLSFIFYCFVAPLLLCSMEIRDLCLREIGLPMCGVISHAEGGSQAQQHYGAWKPIWDKRCFGSVVNADFQPKMKNKALGRSVWVTFWIELVK